IERNVGAEGWCSDSNKLIFLIFFGKLGIPRRPSGDRLHLFRGHWQAKVRRDARRRFCFCKGFAGFVLLQLRGASRVAERMGFEPTRSF
ncbi:MULTISPECIES: hypothetical protein, partial [unclassified Mesorhizobium]|uniref:hypothetical protein n=1 Tax=unclassified Mesorhizobium TaxID=325217 RepID=UPI001AECC8EC